MSNPFIDQALLDAVSGQARESARLRRNHNFHVHETDASHRLLNAIEPGSYVAPHRHLDPAKDETMIVLRGALGVVLFDDAGCVTASAVLRPGGDRLGINIPHGTWHSVLGLVSGAVFFEAKAGPYVPLIDAERAPFAPLENSPEANEFYKRLVAVFAV